MTVNLTKRAILTVSKRFSRHKDVDTCRSRASDMRCDLISSRTKSSNAKKYDDSSRSSYAESKRHRVEESPASSKYEGVRFSKNDDLRSSHHASLDKEQYKTDREHDYTSQSASRHKRFSGSDRNPDRQCESDHRHSRRSDSGSKYDRPSEREDRRKQLDESESRGQTASTNTTKYDHRERYDDRHSFQRNSYTSSYDSYQSRHSDRSDNYASHRRDPSYYRPRYHDEQPTSRGGKSRSDLLVEIEKMLKIEYHHTKTVNRISTDEPPEVVWCPKYTRPDIVGHIRGRTDLLHHKCRRCRRLCLHLLGQPGTTRMCLECAGWKAKYIPEWYFHNGCKYCR